MKNPVLLVSCADQRGLVHAVTGVLLRAGCNIVSNQEFVDESAQRFFMRTEFEGPVDCAALEAETRVVLPVGAEVQARPPTRHRIAILVSKEHHCLADLLVRHAYGELHAELVAVAGNHDTLRPWSKIRRALLLR